jgi:proton-coupled amino acid transporter
MSSPREVSPSTRPLPVPITSGSHPSSFRGPNSGSSVHRASSTARLASPVPSHTISGTPQIRQIPTPNQGVSHSQQPLHSGDLTPLAGPAPHSSLPGPGISALAAALSNSFGQSPPRFGTPPIRPLSPGTAGHQIQQAAPPSNYGSFDARGRSIQGSSGWAGPNTFEDPEIVRRHLVQSSETEQLPSKTAGGDGGIFGDAMSFRGGSPAGKARQAPESIAPGLDDDEFSSLRLQGGDITRPIYKWTEEAQARATGRGKGQRSMSFNLSRPYPEDETMDIDSIKIPGGFRRNFLRRAAGSPTPQGQADGAAEENIGVRRRQPKLLTNNFIEFLTIYGHFAGEELEEDDEVLGPGEYFSSEADGEGDRGDDEDREPMEDSALLTPGLRKRRRKERKTEKLSNPTDAFFLLLKSFVGTGVLFLPKAYLNGGMLFSNLVLVFVAALSYYCFVLLVNTRLVVEASFGDMGGVLYGRWMRNTILASIVVSQIGFVAAYIVFTSENLQAFIRAVSNCKTNIEIQYLILMQMAIFLPFSLLRDISKLGFTALIADAFILIGLLYLYYYDFLTIASNGVADIINFNKNDWTLFIGTAIFTFEGIGLIIPIQESMKDPKKFPKVLGLVMIIISVVFISMGALSYAAFGSATETVVILNMPQDSKFVNAVQFLYSVAILLSTPLQIFPAIKITENELFTRSGKYNPHIKWQKNVFRFFVVMLCAAIAWIGANDLDKFVSIVGSFACVPLVYIYPVRTLWLPSCQLLI